MKTRLLLSYSGVEVDPFRRAGVGLTMRIHRFRDISVPGGSSKSGRRAASSFPECSVAAKPRRRLKGDNGSGMPISGGKTRVILPAGTSRRTGSALHDRVTVGRERASWAETVLCVNHYQCRPLSISYLPPSSCSKYCLTVFASSALLTLASAAALTGCYSL